MSQPVRQDDVDGPKTGDIGRFSAHQSSLDAEVGRIAGEQFGVVSLEQLEGLGLTGDAVVKGRKVAACTESISVPIH
jgi:hypothetical protein